MPNRFVSLKRRFTQISIDDPSHVRCVALNFIVLRHRFDQTGFQKSGDRRRFVIDAFDQTSGTFSSKIIVASSLPSNGGRLWRRSFFNDLFESGRCRMTEDRRKRNSLQSGQSQNASDANRRTTAEIEKQQLILKFVRQSSEKPIIDESTSS